MGLDVFIGNEDKDHAELDGQEDCDGEENLRQGKVPLWEHSSLVGNHVGDKVKEQVDHNRIFESGEVHGDNFTRGRVVPSSAGVTITECLFKM